MAKAVLLTLPVRHPLKVLVLTLPCIVLQYALTCEQLARRTASLDDPLQLLGDADDDDVLAAAAGGGQSLAAAGLMPGGSPGADFGLLLVPAFNGGLAPAGCCGAGPAAVPSGGGGGGGGIAALTRILTARSPSSATAVRHDNNGDGDGGDGTLALLIEQEGACGTGAPAPSLRCRHSSSHVGSPAAAGGQPGGYSRSGSGHTYAQV
jgi:hypothetical protein